VITKSLDANVNLRTFVSLYSVKSMSTLAAMLTLIMFGCKGTIRTYILVVNSYHSDQLEDFAMTRRLLSKESRKTYSV